MNAITTPASASIKKDLLSKTSNRRCELARQTSLANTIAIPPLRDDLQRRLKFERRAIADIKPAKRRVRKVSTAQTERVVKCILRVGVCAPIIIDGDGHVIDGHTVVAAARQLGLESLPCAVIEHLEEKEVEYLRIALNRISERGEWDLEELRPVLIELSDEGIVLEDTGFSIPELDAILIDDGGATGAPPEEEKPLDPPVQPVSRLGDLWILGNHRLYCGDATHAESFDIILKGELVHAIFTDPPWNIPIKDFVSSQHEDFKMGAGEMSDAAFAEFVDRFTRLCQANLEDAGVMFTCIDWRSFDLIVSCARASGLQLINTAVWNKGTGGMGGLYRSAHELIPVFCKGKAPRVNNVGLGKHGRDRTNVWSYPGANRRGSSAGKALKDHPTPKPIEMVHDAIIDISKPGEIVLDPFMGSGTTILAAERAGRVARGVELDPAYVDVCITRWQSKTGREAVHQASGLTFNQLQRARDKKNENLATFGESAHD